MTEKLWLVGCGTMGGAMLRRWLDVGTLAPADVRVIDRAQPADLPTGVALSDTLPEAPAAVVMLAFKPQNLGDFARDHGARFGAETTLISVLAGVTTAQLRSAFPGAGSVVRAMPNLPVAIGKGATALFAGAEGRSARATADPLFAALGAAIWLDDEAMFDAVTALSGCGPGFVFRFIDQLAQAAVAFGVPANQAMALALRTVEGAAAMASESSETVETLANRVASAGGATRAGLDVLDADDALGDLLRRTLAAAAKRSAELGKLN